MDNFETCDWLILIGIVAGFYFFYKMWTLPPKEK